MGKARELEVAVLGNDEPIASVVGEIVPGKEFYDYEAKYLSEGSQAIIPAKLTKQQSKQVQAMALDAFRACDCAGWRGWTFSSRRAIPDGSTLTRSTRCRGLPRSACIPSFGRLRG